MTRDIILIHKCINCKTQIRGKTNEQSAYLSKLIPNASIDAKCAQRQCQDQSKEQMLLLQQISKCSLHKTFQN